MAMLGLSAVIGVLLGFYGRVFAVVPALATVLLATAAVDAGAPLLSVLVHAILVCTVLELCYLAALISPSVLRRLLRSATAADGADAAHRNRRDRPFALSN